MKLTWEEFKKELKDRGHLHILWHEDDILSVLEERSIIVSQEELATIKVFIERNFDAQVGINWEILEGYVDAYFYEKSLE